MFSLSLSDLILILNHCSRFFFLVWALWSPSPPHPAAPLSLRFFFFNPKQINWISKKNFFFNSQKNHRKIRSSNNSFVCCQHPSSSLPPTKKNQNRTQNHSEKKNMWIIIIKITRISKNQFRNNQSPTISRGKKKLPHHKSVSFQKANTHTHTPTITKKNSPSLLPPQTLTGEFFFVLNLFQKKKRVLCVWVLFLGFYFSCNPLAASLFFRSKTFWTGEGGDL